MEGLIDRETKKQMDKQINKEADGKTCKWRERQINKQMKGESLGQVEKLKERQIGKKKNSQTDVITDEQTNG